MGPLANCKILVIGGASGMGRGIAEEAAEAGARVTIAGTSPEKLEGAAKEIGLGTEYAVVDITDEKAVEDFFGSVHALDHLAITAGPGSRSDFRTQTVTEAHDYMEGKFWSTYRAAWHAQRRLARTGSMTFLTGGLAVRPTAGTAVVTSAFGAVEGLARALAVELAPIRVNVIRPGMIDTPLWSFLPEKERDALYAEAAGKAPAGRVGTAREVGRAAVYLMTNEFVTGTVLDVDGGALLR